MHFEVVCDPPVQKSQGRNLVCWGSNERWCPVSLPLFEGTKKKANRKLRQLIFPSNLDKQTKAKRYIQNIEQLVVSLRQGYDKQQHAGLVTPHQRTEERSNMFVAP